MYRHEKYGSSTGGLASTHRLQQIANVMLMVSGVRSDGIISVRAGIEELPNYFDLLAHVCYDIRLIVEINTTFHCLLAHGGGGGRAYTPTTILFVLLRLVI